MKTLPLDLLRRPLGQRPSHRTPKPPGKEKTAGKLFQPFEMTIHGSVVLAVTDATQTDSDK